MAEENNLVIGATTDVGSAQVPGLQTRRLETSEGESELKTAHSQGNSKGMPRELLTGGHKILRNRPA